MRWLQLSAQVPREFVEPVSYLFNRYGRALTVEELQEEQVLLRTYLPSTARQALTRIEIGVKLVAHLTPAASFTVEEVRQEDWESAWKAHFSLQRVGERIIIRPSWVEYEPAPEEVMITLDPGMAFGTGYHPTTRMCLCQIEQRARPGLAVLDMGTGSGILALAAAKLGAGPILAMDTDATAVKVSRANCRANGDSRRVQVVRGTLPHPQAPPESFDLVLANISAKVIQAKAPHILEVLRPEGTLVASGVISQNGKEVAAALAEAGFIQPDAIFLEEWTTITAMKAG